MSFSEKLKENQMKHAETALLQTVFQDPNQTIGDIWDALESDAESEIMWDMFKRLTIGKLVTAGVHFAEGEMAKKPAASASKPADGEEDEDEFEDDDEVEYEEEDDEFEDDDEEGDDEEEDEDEDEEEEEEDEPKKKKSRKKSKASSGKKSKAKATKKEPKELDLSSPELQKAYRHAIIKCLKSNKCRDEDTALSSTDIRRQVNGSPKQFRDAVNELIEAERVAFAGKARGMKYWLN